MKAIDKLKKLRRPVLVEMAERLGIKVSVRWTRPTLAKKIIEKQKLDELYQEPDSGPEPEPEGPKRKPVFEDLATEGTQEVTAESQEPKDGRGGYREGAGRTLGLTDEKARVQRVLKNKVPDPVVQFVVECLFGLTGEPKKKVVEPNTDMIAVPATNLIAYYFPDLHVSPVLQVWFDLVIGVKNLVVSRLVARKAEQVTEPTEGDDNGKGSDN